MVPYIDMSTYDQGGCLHDLFARQVAETPNNVAVVSADGRKVKLKNSNSLIGKFTGKFFFRLHFLS